MSESIKLNDNKYWSTSNIMYDSSTILSNILTIDTVMETGENENGWYIHFNSGLLVCFKKVAFSNTSTSYCTWWGDGNYYYNQMPSGAIDAGWSLGAPAKAFTTMPFVIIQAESTTTGSYDKIPIYCVHNEAGLAGPTHLGVANVLTYQAATYSGYFNVMAIGMAA